MHNTYIMYLCDSTWGPIICGSFENSKCKQINEVFNASHFFIIHHYIGSMYVIDASYLKGVLNCAWYQASGMPDLQA